MEKKHLKLVKIAEEKGESLLKNQGKNRNIKKYMDLEILTIQSRSLTNITGLMEQILHMANIPR